jgi:hypothetical protein
MDTAEARVARGVAWLDAQPELAGWRDRINRDTIDMALPDLCIAGQVIAGLEWPSAPDWWVGHFPGDNWMARAGYTRLTLTKTGGATGWNAAEQGFLGIDGDDDAALKAAWLDVLPAPVPADDEG